MSVVVKDIVTRDVMSVGPMWRPRTASRACSPSAAHRRGAGRQRKGSRRRGYVGDDLPRYENCAVRDGIVAT